ncbi:hypothetical protein [Flavobacterium sp. '19STA2R22 D10 B1']|uniref:hypothetical protein n=1 Tax=Flavobacterium aerium TaxID=3037261 RepID=UPI00278BF79E|nr:hypothetical protein [Flavobacterium sp. '19STA2R22 D10 B1']
MYKLIVLGVICLTMGCKTQSSRETIDLTKMGYSLDAHEPKAKISKLPDTIRIIKGKVVPIENITK